MKKILVVDDEPDILTIVRLILHRAGFEAESVSSGEECLDRLKEIKPDLILMDIMMRGLSGWEACKMIKENKGTKGVPVIMLTVRAGADSKERSITHAKADGHICKPINQEELISAIKSSLK